MREFKSRLPHHLKESKMNIDFIEIAMNKHKLNFVDTMMLIESCASCAIEGNKTGDEVCRLFNKEGRLNVDERKRVSVLLNQFMSG